MKFDEEECTELTKRVPEQEAHTDFQVAIEYDRLNQIEKLMGARKKLLKRIVDSAAELYGEIDDNGSFILTLEEEVEIGIPVRAEIKRLKKTTRTLNEVAAEELLKEKGLWESCIQVVTTYEIDEDKVIQAYNAGKITAGELENLFYEKVTYATTVETNDPSILEIKQLRKKTEKGELLGREELPEIESGE